MIPVFPTAFPPSNTPVVDKATGAMSTVGMAFWRALFNRTGMDNGLTATVNGSMAGAGATQAAATAIETDWVVITGAGGGGVRLPALTGGQSIVIFHNAAAPTNLYPPVGGEITFLSAPSGVDAPLVLGVPDAVICYYFSATDIQVI